MGWSRIGELTASRFRAARNRPGLLYLSKAMRHFPAKVWLLQLSLLCGALLRINVFSFVYGILALGAPFLPVNSSGILSWWTKRYSQSAMVTGLMCGVAQIIFHVSLLADPPYGHDFSSCSTLEKLARQFGFQRLDIANGWDLIRLVMPEVLVCAVSIHTYVKCTENTHSSPMFDHFMPELLMEQLEISPVSQTTESAFKNKSEDVSEGEKWKAWLNRKRLQQYFAAINDIAVACMLGAAGIIKPCLASAPYFFIYLFLVANWSYNRTLKDKYWWMIRKWACVHSALHLVMLYLYQFPFIQEAIPPDCFVARFFGMTVIAVSQCQVDSKNPSKMFLAPASEWPVIINPFILMGLYCLTAVQLRIYFENCDEEVISEVEERVPKISTTSMRPIMISSQPPLRYAVTKPPPWATEALLTAKRSLSSLAERTTLSRTPSTPSPDEQPHQPLLYPSTDIVVTRSDSKLNKSQERTSPYLKSSLLTLERSPRVESRLSRSPRQELTRRSSSLQSKRASEEQGLSWGKTRRQPIYMASGMGAVVDAGSRGALSTITNFIKSQSYVASLFMMMAWSITYHSWSTFVLLLIACCVWMVPDSRSLCLRLSPFVAMYSNVLLAIQFIYGIDLTESELPDEKPIILRQLGFEKPRSMPSCIPLFIKCTFTLMFSVTLHQYLQERAGNERELIEGAIQQPFHVAFSTGKSESDRRRSSVMPRRASAMSRESGHWSAKMRARSTSVLNPAAKVKQFGMWARSLVSKYWVMINLSLLLFISLRSPVVIYRVIYMAYFLGFVNCFQISFPLWRKILYVFWMVMVCYCMTVLTLIYTYQFHGFPEMWESGTGWSHEVFSSLGLEKFSSGELFVKLLTPISFLIFTLVQVNFFHKDLMDRTLKWQQAVYPNAFSRTNSILRRATMISRTMSKSVTRSVSSTTRAVKRRMSKSPRTAKRGSFMRVPSGDSQSEGSNTIADVNKNELPQDEKKAMSKAPSQSTIHTTPEKKAAPGKTWVALIEQTWTKITSYQDRMANMAWRFTEIHIKKLISMKMMWICVHEVSACNIPYMMSIAVTLPFENLDVIAGHILGVWSSCIIVLKMLYQMKFIRVSDIAVQCSTVPGVNGTVYHPSYPFHANTTADGAAWFGFWKNDNISDHVEGHLQLIILLAFRTVCHMRQCLHRKHHKEFKPLRSVLMPKITRLDADDGIKNCLMYFGNYFFYKFGLEICFISTVITVGYRADFVSIFYSVSLICLLTMRRRKVAKIWPFYVSFLAIMLPLQYMLCVGIPPSLCSSYPWTHWDDNLVEWLYLPDFATPPDPLKLTADFFQLMCASCQWYVFRVETGDRAKEYSGGDNSEIYRKEKDTPDASGLESPTELSNQPTFNGVPVPDYISYSKSYLDMIKNVFFVYFYWATLAVVFVAGTSRVTLFALGYVIGCFGFLWVGNELFLKPMKFALKLWNALMMYNVIIIFLKTSTQVVGCVYVRQMYTNYCWVLQLFGIACLKPGFDPTRFVNLELIGECNVPHEEAGIFFDGICFVFLIIQRRIFGSYYFQHVIAEFSAQQIFASRGAELITLIQKKDITDEQKRQDEIVIKVKSKMEKIKQRELNKGGKAPKLKKERSRDAMTPSSQSKGPSPQVNLRLSQLFQSEEDQESISLPVESFDDQLVPDSLNDLLATSPIHERRPHTLPIGTHIASPTAVRKNGVFHSIMQMQKCDEMIPVALMEEVVPKKEPSPETEPCNLIGPHVLPSPESQNYVPFLTSPPPARKLRPKKKKASTGVKKKIKEKEQKARQRSPTPPKPPPAPHPRRTQPTPTPPAPAPRSRSSTISLLDYKRGRSTSMGAIHKGHAKKRHKTSPTHSSGSDMEFEPTDSLYSSHSDIGLHFDESATGSGKDEDRRRGLGPLQLLNVAFKKGAIKQAVKESRELEQQETKLEQQMKETFGHSDSKAIRRHLWNRKSRKAKADFREEGFEEEPITLVVGDDEGDGGLKVPYQARRKSTVELEMEFAREAKELGLDDEEELLPPPPDYEDIVDKKETTLRKETETAAEILAEQSEEKLTEEESEEETATTTEQETTIYKIKKIFQGAKEYVVNTIAFVQLFGVGVIESVITWLLKFSRDYRYVAHVLSVEKRTQKEITAAMPKDAETDPTKLPEEVRRKVGAAALGSFMGDESMYKLHKYLQSQDPLMEGSISRRTSVDTILGRDRSKSFDEDLETQKFEEQHNVFVRLFTASYYLLISRSELFCYAMLVLNHMSSASFLTMPLPIMTFAWGTLSIPRPSKMFWITVITYTEAMVITKYLFAFGFIPWNKGVANPHPFWAPRILGILKKDEYAGWDLALLMTLFFHRAILKTLGLWTEDPEQTSSAAKDDSKDKKSKRKQLRREASRLSKRSGEGSLLREVDSVLSEDEKLLALREKLKDPAYAAYHYRKVKIKQGLIAYAKMVVAFFRTLLNPVDRMPLDVYALQFLCDFICFVIVIFGYWAFGPDSGEGGVAAVLEENKVPGALLVQLIFQFSLIIIDRALFLRKFQLGKVIYQYGLVIMVHFWVFCLLPNITERYFVTNTPLKLWYCIKCIYFCISAWQIRSGYPTRGSSGNFLTKQYTLINWLLFKIFMVLPFLFELRTLMDWIWTDTSLGIGDWLKLSDIYSNIYLLKCERQFERDYPSPRGVRKRALIKYGLGGVMLVAIVLIIWFPLVLFSLLNTVGMRSLPVDCTVRLSISGYETLYENSARQSNIRALTEDEYQLIDWKYRYSKYALTYMADYSNVDVVKAMPGGNSSNMWSISPPAKQRLITHLNSSTDIIMRFEWHFTRSAEGLDLSSPTVNSENQIIYHPGHPLRTQMILMLLGNRTSPIEIPHLFPPFVKVPGKGEAKPATALLTDRVNKGEPLNASYYGVYLDLQRGTNIYDQMKTQWWRMKMIKHNWEPKSTKQRPPDIIDHLEIIGFTDKVFPASFSFITGGGIFSLYGTMCIVVGRFIRGQITGSMGKIMYEELPNVDRILQLCLDIFLVREAGEFALEEDLFAKLIFLYRSPATLIKWTKEKME